MADVPKMNLAAIGGYLVVLTAASFFVTYLLLGQPFWSPLTNALFVLMVGFLKASLVVGFFMHYRYEKAWKYVLTIPVCLLAICLVIAMLPDLAAPTYPTVTWHFQPPAP